MPADKHPWGAFLHARARALRWLRDEMHETPELTARTMSMDPLQVGLILAHVDASPVEYPIEAQPEKADPMPGEADPPLTRDAESILAAIVMKAGGVVHLSEREMVDSIGLTLEMVVDQATGVRFYRAWDRRERAPAGAKEVAGSTPAGTSTVAGVRSPEGDRGVVPSRTPAQAGRSQPEESPLFSTDSSRAAWSEPHDISPPWIIFSDNGKPVAILPAGRPGEVADVRDWEPGVAVHLVQCANAFHDALITAGLQALAHRIRRLMAPFDGSPSSSAAKETP